MKLYHLHIWSSGEIDADTNQDRSTHPPITSNLGIEFDDFPADDLFKAWPDFIASNRLKCKLIYWGITGFKFEKIERVSLGYNFIGNYGETDIGSFWKVLLNESPENNDVFTYKRQYLICNAKTLEFLRDNNVTHAECNEITCSLEDYFNSDLKKFWM